MPDNNYILGTLSSGESVPLLQADRRRHVYVVGMTGTGKTGLLLNLMHADLLAGAGFCFLDPHGDASQRDRRRDADASARADVIYLDPSDPTHTFAYNPLAGVPEAERATSAANIVSAFKNIWANSWGPRLEYVLGQCAALVARQQGSKPCSGFPGCWSTTTIAIGWSCAATIPLIRFYWLTEFAALRFTIRARDDFADPKQGRRIPRQPVHPIDPLPEFFDDRHLRT